MFVRRKHNKSGSTSIQVITKIDGKYRVQKSFGSNTEETVLSSLERKARQWADNIMKKILLVVAAAVMMAAISSCTCCDSTCKGCCDSTKCCNGDCCKGGCCNKAE